MAVFVQHLGAVQFEVKARRLRKQPLPKEGVRVRVTADKVKNPPRLDSFRIEAMPPLALSVEQRDGLEESVRHCLIHHTLLHPSRIELVIAAPL